MRMLQLFVRNNRRFIKLYGIQIKVILVDIVDGANNKNEELVDRIVEESKLWIQNTVITVNIIKTKIIQVGFLIMNLSI